MVVEVKGQPTQAPASKGRIRVGVSKDLDWTKINSMGDVVRHNPRTIAVTAKDGFLDRVYRALLMTGPFEIHDELYADGDWLMLDPIDGAVWGVRAQDYLRWYRAIEVAPIPAPTTTVEQLIKLNDAKAARRGELRRVIRSLADQLGQAPGGSDELRALSLARTYAEQALMWLEKAEDGS